MNLIDKIIEECEKALAEREKLKQSAKQFDKTCVKLLKFECF
jgi:hypothetical protein